MDGTTQSQQTDPPPGGIGPLPEAIVFGRYELVDRLAVGGMAEIFKARSHGDHGFEKTVVIKRMLPHLARDPEFLAMFVDEARVMGRLNHPKIVQVLDFGTVDKQFFIAMEYVDGTDVLAILQRCAERRCRASVGVAVHIVAEVLDALDYAHKMTDEEGKPLHIVHRDISPSNIFVSRRGDVKLGDFGIVRAAMRQGCTEVGILKGKYGYMAPEQVAGQPSDHRADIFAAGIVLAELLMNRRLFAARNELDVLLQVRDARIDRLDRFGQHIPPDLREILEAALGRDPNLRYQDASSFRDALLYFLFNNRRMVHSAQICRFLARLDQREPLGATPADEAAPVQSPPDERPSATTAVGKQSALDATTAEKISPPGSARQVGNKRKIVLSPPPAPPNVTTDTGEEARIATEDAHEAIPELARPSANEITARRLVPDATAEPEPPDEVAARFSTDLSDQQSDRKGTLDDCSLLKLMFGLATREDTGLLVLKSGSGQKEIYFVDGHPQSVTSNQPGELFGQYLVGKGVISDGELSMALAVLPRFAGKLGDALVGLKLLTPMEVLRHLTHQVRQRLLDAFAWNEGTFAYFADHRCAHESAPLGLDAFELLGAGLSAMPKDTINARLASLMGRRIKLVAQPPVPPEVFRLGPRTTLVCKKLDGDTELRSLLNQIEDPTQRNEFARVVYLLTETGLAEPV